MNRQPGEHRSYGAGDDPYYGGVGDGGERGIGIYGENPYGYYGQYRRDMEYGPASNYPNRGVEEIDITTGRARVSYPEQVPGRFRRGPKGYRKSDERLTEDLSEQLMRAEEIDSSEVTITVRDSIVTLEGTVPQRYMKYAIEDLMADSPGVDEVHNRIRIQREPSL